MHDRTRRTSRFLLAAAVTGIVAASAWGQVTNEGQKLLALDGEAFDQFGQSIAIDTGIVAIGSAGDDDNGPYSGSAYLFNSSTGAQLLKLHPGDGAEDDYFGYSIGIDSGLVVVGAVWDRDNGVEAGSAYVFDATTGAQLHKLLPSDGQADAWFGTSIAISGGTVAVGAPYHDAAGNDSGAVYLFDATTGAQTFRLVPADAAPDDLFGYSVSISNGVVAVGAVWGDDMGENSGCVYLFNASTGAEIRKLVPADGAANDHFGGSVAIDGGVLGIGASGDDDNGSAAGSAYVFDAGTGVQQFKLLPNDGGADDLFGWAVAASGGHIAVGAYGDDDNGGASGSAYVFDAGTGVQLRKLLAGDGAAGDHFGYAIAARDGGVAVGAPLDDDSGEDSGSAYVFEAVCRADLTGDGVVDTLDFLLFLGAWSQGNSLADWDGNGAVNTLDFLAYLNDWSAGC